MNSKLSDSNWKMFIRLFCVCLNYNNSLSAHINFMPRLYESRLEGGWIGKSEIYKLKAQLQVGVCVRNKTESKREGENKSTKK